MNELERRRADLRAVPDLTGRSRGELAEIGIRDALALVADVRDVDPRVVWGRLTRWAVEDTARLVMATVALAALVAPDVEPRAALAWTEHLVKEAA